MFADGGSPSVERIEGVHSHTHSHTHLQVALDARQALQGHMGSTAPRTDDTDVMLEAEEAASFWRPHLMLLRGRWEAKLLSMADTECRGDEKARP